MTPKDVEFALGQIECSVTHEILSRYVKGLELMLAENTKTINPPEELLDINEEELESLLQRC